MTISSDFLGILYFFATPHGRGQWLSLRVDAAFDWSVVEELVKASYRRVALKRMALTLDARAYNWAVSISYVALTDRRYITGKPPIKP